MPSRKTQVVGASERLETRRIKVDSPTRGTYVQLRSTNREPDAALIAELGRRTSTER